MKNVLKDNERLLEQSISVDILNIVVHDHVNSADKTVNVCERCVPIETELQKNFIKKECYDMLFKSSILRERHIIVKLKERLKSLRGNVKEDKIKKELEEIETINIELDHRVTKLVAENEHLKQTYKQLYDSIKSSCVRSKEQCDDLIKQVNIKSAENSDLNASLQEKVLVIAALKETLSRLKGKAIVNEVVSLHSIDPKLLKIDVAPLAPKLGNNRTAHTDYLRHTQEETATLKEIVKSEILLNPLNTSFDYACKYTKRIQELLIILQQTCHCITYLGTKLMAPQGNTKNDRIQRAPIKAKKNKLEDHHRTVRPSLTKKKSVVDTTAISSVMNSKLNVNVDLKCDTYLEVAFRQHTCFIRNLDGVDLLTGSRGNNLYALSLQDMMASSPICLLSKASKPKSWIWHRRLSHLNFGNINHIARQGIVRGLPKLKFEKDHLCSACAMGKSTKKSHKPKSEDTNQEKLYLLHMDLCGPMRVESVNGKKYILNGVVERRNRTLIKAARTMLIYAQALLFIWVEAVATACYTQNRSIIRLRQGKKPYEILHNKLPELSFVYVFGALCYPTNDSENLGKLQLKVNIGIFIGYAPTKKGFWINNRHTRRIVETIHVDFDELTAMASEQSSSEPTLNEMTPATISSGLVQKSSSSTPYVPPSRNDWDLLFQPMFDELLNPSPSVDHQAAEVIAPIADVIPPVHAVSTD
nr:integrase, catalytic region, zinc finger, CCHC-type, peptidase aspartic, catalytic [Tanacetum cinerariifolium]